MVLSGTSRCLFSDKYNTNKYSVKSVRFLNVNLLRAKRRLLYLKASSYRAVNIFHLGYKSRSI
jgi:hypothetical protein